MKKQRKEERKAEKRGKRERRKAIQGKRRSQVKIRRRTKVRKREERPGALEQGSEVTGRHEEPTCDGMAVEVVSMDGGEAWDDVRRGWLDRKKVHVARLEEVG